MTIVVVLDNCDTNTGWNNFGDSAPEETDAVTKYEGAGSIKGGSNRFGGNSEYDKTLGTQHSIALTNKIDLWVYITAAAKAVITGIKVRVGSDNANNYEKTFSAATITPLTWTQLEYTFAAATQNGTPDITKIDYLYIDWISSNTINFEEIKWDYWTFSYEPPPPIPTYKHESKELKTEYPYFYRDGIKRDYRAKKKKDWK